MAGDILANIASDYESATMMGYKNLVKLRFANLVRNSKTGIGKRFQTMVCKERC